VQEKVKRRIGAVRIGELARRAGTSARTLRFYEQAGLLPAPLRTPSGYRDYDDAAVDRLAFVRAAQAAGLTLAEIREVVAVREAQGPPCAHVVGLLDRHADELDARIAELEATRAEVRRLRDRAATLDPAACVDADVCTVLT
jgi:DNA-binding transcriptional MerR regulator